MALRKLLNSSFKVSRIGIQQPVLLHKYIQHCFPPLTSVLAVIVKWKNIIIFFLQLQNQFFLHQTASRQDKPEWSTNPRKGRKKLHQSGPVETIDWAFIASGIIFNSKSFCTITFSTVFNFCICSIAQHRAQSAYILSTVYWRRRRIYFLHNTIH